jgi:hypothetical protein
LSVVVWRDDWRGSTDEGAEKARLARLRMARREDFILIDDTAHSNTGLGLVRI